MIHITIGGERIPISEMTLSHLINTINCIKDYQKRVILSATDIM